MDPTANINALRQYMDFYRQNHQRAPSYTAPGASNFQATSFNDDAPAMAWAQQQMQQDQGGGQDFFGQAAQGAPQYAAPRTVQDLSHGAGFPLAPQDQTPSPPQRPEVTRAGMASNFLRTLFSR